MIFFILLFMFCVILYYVKKYIINGDLRLSIMLCLLFFFIFVFEVVDWNIWILREYFGGEDLVNNMVKWYLNFVILIYSEVIDINDVLWINFFFLNYVD